MAACAKDSYWYIYIIACVVTYISGVIILGAAKMWWHLFCRKQQDDVDNWRLHQSTGMRRALAPLRAAAHNLIAGHTHFSKFYKVLTYSVNMAAILLYLVEATQYSLDDCEADITEPVQLVWLAFCSFFLLEYIIRLTASSDKLFTWMDIYSAVDHCTIVPTVVGFILGRNWLGLKCLRMVYFLQTAELLQLLHILKTKPKIRLAQIASIFLAIWWTSSGFVHICENSGDPHHRYENGQKLGFWECVYWLLVTMSTVGFGEITPSTDIGRAFITLFIMGSFAMFTSIIPEVVLTVGRKSKYHQPYKRIYGKRHIIVCGHIGTNNVCNFIKNLVHEDVEKRDINVVFVEKMKPDLELEAFFKRHFNDVIFFQGTVMDLKTLQMIKLRDASACLIMANRQAADPEEEDKTNIMRAIAVKNYANDIRVIIQLLQPDTKTLLLHIPHWRWGKAGGDHVVCVSELKNGILAQNCLAPGFSTLISNLFTNRSYKPTTAEGWKDNYLYGAGHEIYAVPFSPAFDGMTFAKAAAICFTEFNVLLVAVDVSQKRNKTMLRVNPGTSIKLTAESIGYFFAQGPETVKRVTHFYHTKQDSKMAVLFGDDKEDTNADDEPDDDAFITPGEQNYLKGIGSRLANYDDPLSPPGELEMDTQEVNQEIFDPSGTIYWCVPRKFEDCILDGDEALGMGFNNHVILIVLANEDSPGQGLMNFVVPLRNSNYRFNELKDIVIFSNAAFIEKEWNTLATLPKIYVFDGSLSSRYDLMALNCRAAQMCVIMSAKGHTSVDQMVVDREVVLATLTLKGMFGSYIDEKLVSPSEFHQVVGKFDKYRGLPDQLPLITEIESDSSVAFLDPDDDDHPDTPLYLTVPYVAGRTFTTSVLDSLMSCTFLNSEVLTLLRTMITGFERAELEQILAKGLGVMRRNTMADYTAARNRSRIAQLSLSKGPLEKLEHFKMYGELFTQALKTYGILCLGLYRLIDPEQKDPRHRTRYVMTNPTFNFELWPSDRVFILEPFSYADGTTPEPKRRLNTADTYSDFQVLGADKSSLNSKRTESLDSTKL